MIIKALELQGFKSFPEKTKIIFHPGITAIIGPNGTGKSNIVDAILWVLGGKRFKGIRGERGEEIIFNGNTKRPPLSMADVTLYLENNEEELAINHRFFRSGESEYRLNGKISRLKDIQDALWKKSIGEKDYFVIEQGSIGLFLNSKPTEKRLLVEEAAGTAFYKEKKRQAEQKLENSEQNLGRLEDILTEVLRTKNTLQRQARAAIRYRKLREKVRHLTSLFLRRKIDELEKAKKEIYLKLEELLSIENETLKRVKNEERNLSSIRIKATELERILREEQELLFRLNSNLSKIEGEKEGNSKRIEFLREKSSSAKRNVEEMKKDYTSLEKECKNDILSLKELNEELGQREKELMALEVEQKKTEEEFALLKKEVERLKEEQLKALLKLTELKNERIKNEKEQELILRQEKKLALEHSTEKRNLSEKENNLKKKEEELKQILEIKQEWEKDLLHLEKEKKEILSSITHLEEKITELEAQKKEAIHQLSALEKMKEEVIKEEKHPQASGCMGLLADFLKCQLEYIPLVDTFWKEEAKALVFETKHFLSLLAQKKMAGKFFLLNKEKKTEDKLEGFEDHRILGRLKKTLQPDSKIKDNIWQLEEALIVQDIRTAIELWLINPGVNYITLEGDVLFSSGLLKTRETGRGLLFLNAEISRLRGIIEEVEDNINPLSLEIGEKKKRLQGVDLNLVQRKIKLAELEKKREEIEKKRLLLALEKENIERKISLYENERRILVGEKSRILEKLNFLFKEIELAEKEEKLLKNRVEIEQKNLEEHREKREKEAKKYFELKRKTSLIEEKIRNFSSQIKNLEQRKIIIASKIDEAQKEMDISEKEITELKEKNLSFDHEIKKLKREIEAKEKSFSLKEFELKTEFEEQKREEELLNKLKETYEARKEERLKWEIKKAEKERDLVNLEENCWQELRKSVAEIKKEINDETLFYEPNLEKALFEAREELQKFKAVNMTAEEEYLAQKKRYEFLIKQRQDLRESIASTKEAIRKIDEESKNKFLEALREVEKNFQEVFALLFNGGTSGLKLIDPANPLESGVEIIAQPPGKKFQTLSLLSGGEKSLTSLAFFFALFRYKPAPFCVLDEVDAALDEINLARFLNLMKKIKNQTQFILITHNFKTMEVADYIYGTTMAEPNITSVYSVKLEKKELP